LEVIFVVFAFVVAVQPHHFISRYEHICFELEIF